MLHNEYIDRIARTKLPMVFIDREYSGERMSSVIIDNMLGATMAMEFLIKLGHRRIGFIHGIYNADAEARYLAYENVLKKYGIPLDESIILRGYFEEAVAYSEMRVSLLKGTEIPDAFFCANDEMAYGCIRALSDSGIKVPDDVSVIGFDDIMVSQFYNPALTTIHSPITELGNYSTNELIRLMGQEKGKGKEIRLSPTLTVRDTCKVRI
jgi:LacI family purine nucleotide synthesis repressor